MPAPHIVFDIETVLDHEAVARAHNIDIDDTGTVRAVVGDEFPLPAFHRIVCISAMALTYDIPDRRWCVLEAASLHIGMRSEKEILAEFLRYIDSMRPCFVGYHSLSFDLPVLRARAMLHRISGAHIAWRGFKPLPDHHIDLCELLSARGRGRMTLDEAGRVFGLGTKAAAATGSRVADLVVAGDFDAIADYCLNDVAITASLFLLHQNFSGIMDEEALNDALQTVRIAHDTALRDRPDRFMQKDLGPVSAPP